MSDTGPESTAPRAASGGGGARPRRAEADAGKGRTAPFEELQRELDELVARLERGDVPLDEALALWQRGEELYRACVARLDGAELRIEELRSEGAAAGDDSAAPAG